MISQQAEKRGQEGGWGRKNRSIIEFKSVNVHGLGLAFRACLLECVIHGEEPGEAGPGCQFQDTVRARERILARSPYVDQRLEWYLI